MEFNFNSYDTSKQIISYCEVDKCKAVVDLKQKLDQLKAENEELKNFHINLVGVKECQIKELIKYKQALKEIKEIAEEDCKQCFEIDGFSKPDDCGICPYNKILEKISEVIDEN